MAESDRAAKPSSSAPSPRDTVEPVMADAVAMYSKLGFRAIAVYRANPMPGTLDMDSSSIASFDG
jgi:hypothetical protein